jgi:hypothetical protein
MRKLLCTTVLNTMQCDAMPCLLAAFCLCTVLTRKTAPAPADGRRLPLVADLDDHGNKTEDVV